MSSSTTNAATKKQERDVYDDIDNLKETPWRDVDTDITDYFNYGFDEQSWRAYCENQRRMRQVAKNVRLRANRVDFSNPPSGKVSSTSAKMRNSVSAKVVSSKSTAPQPSVQLADDSQNPCTTIPPRSRTSRRQDTRGNSSKTPHLSPQSGPPPNNSKKNRPKVQRHNSYNKTKQTRHPSKHNTGNRSKPPKRHDNNTRQSPCIISTRRNDSIHDSAQRKKYARRHQQSRDYNCSHQRRFGAAQPSRRLIGSNRSDASVQHERFATRTNRVVSERVDPRIKFRKMQVPKHPTSPSSELFPERAPRNWPPALYSRDIVDRRNHDSIRKPTILSPVVKREPSVVLQTPRAPRLRQLPTPHPYFQPLMHYGCPQRNMPMMSRSTHPSLPQSLPLPHPHPQFFPQWNMLSHTTPFMQGMVHPLCMHAEQYRDVDHDDCSESRHRAPLLAYPHAQPRIINPRGRPPTEASIRGREKLGTASTMKCSTVNRQSIVPQPRVRRGGQTGNRGVVSRSKLLKHFEDEETHRNSGGVKRKRVQ